MNRIIMPLIAIFFLPTLAMGATYYDRADAIANGIACGQGADVPVILHSTNPADTLAGSPLQCWPNAYGGQPPLCRGCTVLQGEQVAVWNVSGDREHPVWSYFMLHKYRMARFTVMMQTDQGYMALVLNMRYADLSDLKPVPAPH